MPNQPSPPLSSHFKWQLIVVVISLFAIIFSLLFQLTHIANPDLPLIFAIIFAGIPSCLQILFKLLKGDLGADSLAVIALVTAVILQQNLAAAFIILMLGSGQALEAYAMRKASSALSSLAERMPSMIHRSINGVIKDIPLTDIQLDDLVVVYPHETCPVDGIVVEGRGSMDESYLTGEPYHIPKAPGAMVFSGAINGEAVVTVQTKKLPSDSRYSSIVKVLQEAEQKRPALRRLGDQIGAVFTPAALLFAFATWYFTGDSIRFLSVLVIATPCPLLIAIPITIISAISMAAKQAVIIKDPTVLEQLPTCRTAIFDKTGTLTYGKPVLTEILTDDMDDDMILQYAASLERYSKHPLASAVLKSAEQHHLTLLDAASVSEKPGFGLSGIINGNNIHVTHRKKLIESHPALAKHLPPVSSGLECVVLFNGQYGATLRFHDMPRTESKAFVSHLIPAHQFTKTMLVSGDRESEVKYLGDLLNFSEIYASQTPEQKLAIVRAECAKAPTLFMGDGINDAPALTSATVGIAFGEYSNVSAAAAGAVIMENTLYKVDELIHLSMSVRKIALQSALGGMALCVIGMGFAAAGYIPPVMGAILQEIIDVLAIMNSLRLLWGSKIETDFN